MALIRLGIEAMQGFDVSEPVPGGFSVESTAKDDTGLFIAVNDHETGPRIVTEKGDKDGTPPTRAA